MPDARSDNLISTMREKGYFMQVKVLGNELPKFCILFQQLFKGTTVVLCDSQ